MKRYTSTIVLELEAAVVRFGGGCDDFDYDNGVQNSLVLLALQL